MDFILRFLVIVSFATKISYPLAHFVQRPREHARFYPRRKSRPQIGASEIRVHPPKSHFQSLSFPPINQSRYYNSCKMSQEPAKRVYHGEDEAEIACSLIRLFLPPLHFTACYLPTNADPACLDPAQINCKSWELGKERSRYVTFSSFTLSTL